MLTAIPTSLIRKPMRHLFRVENIDQCGSNWPLGTKMCNFDPKIWIFGAKSHFGPVLRKSHLDHLKKISVSELWVVFGAQPCIGRFVPFILDRFQKLGGTSGPSKKMTQNDNIRKVIFWPKMHFCNFFL